MELTIDSIRRIDDQKVLVYARKFTLPMPDTFVEAHNIKPRDEMVMFRERVNGIDSIIYQPKKLIQNNNKTEENGSNQKTEADFPSDNISG